MQSRSFHFFLNASPRSGPEPEGLKGGKTAGRAKTVPKINAEFQTLDAKQPNKKFRNFSKTGNSLSSIIFLTYSLT
jgi:hypothetical protein